MLFHFISPFFCFSLPIRKYWHFTTGTYLHWSYWIPKSFDRQEADQACVVAVKYQSSRHAESEDENFSRNSFRIDWNTLNDDRKKNCRWNQSWSDLDFVENHLEGQSPEDDEAEKNQNENDPKQSSKDFDKCCPVEGNIEICLMVESMLCFGTY